MKQNPGNANNGSGSKTRAFFLSGQAHVIIQELSSLPPGQAAFVYLGLGYKHILPSGMDHILFILSLFLLSPSLRSLLWQASIFTLAHSITLALAMYRLIVLPPSVIEPLIAISILFVAIENIVSPRFDRKRLGIVFFFGLIHGLGFAGGLASLGLPRQSYALALVMFNAGVELGQLTIIIAAWLLLARPFGKKPYYRRRVTIPISMIIALVAAWWTFERLSL